VEVKLDNKAYDVLKRFAMIWLPAAGTLYFALAQMWHLPAGSEVVGSITALDTFLGVVLHISSTSYEGDGSLTTGVGTEGQKTLTFKLDTDPEDLEGKKNVVFAVKNDPPVA
jgi:hypothetical protein